MDDNIDDDIYSMLVPGEADQGIKISNNNNGKGQKGEINKKPNNIRSPFQENFPYDNIY